VESIIPFSGMPMDRFDMLTAFVAIAEQSSFAAAARSIRSSPPAITRAIAALETHLGVRLFHRSTRSVRLTEEGEAFLDRARRVLADLRDAELSATGAGAEPHGTLVVTASQLFGRLHIVPVVAALMRRHPKLDVRLNLIDRPVQLAEEGIDVAVRIGDLPDSALTGVRLGEVHRVLVASPDYLRRKPAPKSIADLANYDIVAFSGISSTNAWRFGTTEREVVTVRPRLVVNTAEAAIAAAQAGAGITRLLSYQVSAALSDGTLVTIVTKAEPPPAPVTLLFQSGRGAAPNVRAFVEECRRLIVQNLS
jgi:DNA-binding transcriptional LysR family regulator